MRSLAVAAALSIAFPAAAGVGARGPAVQARKIEAGRSALEKLRADPRRRRYRDGWEAIIRLFEGAVKAAPRGKRAPEAALAAARARAELWEVSRSPSDARAALSALRKVDEDYPGPDGIQALASAMRLADRAHEPNERAAAARRLAERSPQDAKAIAGPHAEASAPSHAVTAVVAPPRRPDPEPRPDPATAPAPPESGSEDEEARIDAPAAKAVAQVVQEAKARASARAGEPPEEEDDGEEEPPEPEAPADPPFRTPTIVRAVKTAVAALTEPEDAPARAAKARELRSTALASGSLAGQLGLKVRRVVVDAGHGGRDTGAIGPHGMREKDLALAIAKRVAGRLKVLGYEVVLTRKRDEYVPLDERTRIANEAHADLFISIHCNAARRRKLRGIETWTLNVASDRYAARLAAFENAEADRTVSDLRLILADLATRANASDARDLAESVQSSLVRTLRSRVGPVRDHGVKQALFYVLLGTRMPSILVETGFISNPAEEARLRSARFQDGAAEAIARGVKEYVDSRRRLARAP